MELGKQMHASGCGDIVVSANNCESQNITESLSHTSVNPTPQNPSSEEIWYTGLSRKFQIIQDMDFFKNANELTLFFVSPFCANREWLFSQLKPRTLSAALKGLRMIMQLK